MTQGPLISIIIPVFNRENYIEDTLESVLQQDYDFWECIIVDDGSTDKSWNIITSYQQKDERFKGYKRPSALEKGANSCRNYGYSQAAGEFIQWFDSDDVMLPTKLSQELKAIQESDADYCISLARRGDPKLEPLDLIKFEFDKSQTVFQNYALGTIEVITQMVLWRKYFLRDKAHFNPSIKRGQETEFYSRMFFKSNQFALVENESLIYRQHEDTKTSKNALEYVPNYRYSQSFISCQFYTLGEKSKDAAVMKRYYKFIIHFLYEAAVQGDKITSSFIFEKLETDIIPNNSKRLRALRFGVKAISLTRKKNAYIRKTFFDYNL